MCHGQETKHGRRDKLQLPPQNVLFELPEHKTLVFVELFRKEPRSNTGPKRPKDLG